MQRNNQLVQMKAGGKGWTREATVQQNVMQGGGGATRCNMTTSRQTRGNQEEKSATGDSTSQGSGSALQE
jgi:hypothetical protein